MWESTSFSLKKILRSAVPSGNNVCVTVMREIVVSQEVIAARETDGITIEIFPIIFTLYNFGSSPEEVLKKTASEIAKPFQEVTSHNPLQQQTENFQFNHKHSNDIIT